ncbi:nucleotide pyrophosphohydrolase [Olsenella sp. An293]|uniref:nucleotide pyrophosphohydrolase n=1 Tax=Olsenella sp. An293 TaxID=1965626 RepID=UPI000B3987C2|nr:nucleotide pyrophosphohydrolase [Olsenella sp. An293]OUO31786.1 nucleotide pyrophosphohydrolase [Olsenella sp. An293]
MTFSEVQQEALAFRDARDWLQFHNPKDLALSISLEAAELLECFQWSGDNLSPEGSRARVCEELADVMMYCIYLADVEGIDIPSALHDKIRRNAEHYPVEKSVGSPKKYTEL